MELPRNKQIQLRHLLRQKRNVDRFKARRTYDRLAMDLDVSTVTLVHSMNRPCATGKLTREQIEWAKLMRSEYTKHRQDFKEWTYEALAERLGIGKNTVLRHRQYMLDSGVAQ